MKKSVFKKSISLILAILLLFAVMIPAGAVKFNEGLGSLRAQWKRSKGPSAGGYALEYSYFVPQKASSSNKLPLFVFMAGAGEGASSGKELTANNFAYWSSEEFQERAKGGGAFLQILKAPEPVYFDTVPASSIYAAITDFANKNNVDKSRIYVFGWCIGAVGAAKVVLAHPSEFAGLCLISPRTKISSSEANKLKNNAVWLFGCTKDSYSTYGTYTKPSWNNLVDKTADRTNIRLTSCTSAPTAGALFNHNLWNLCAYDYSSDLFGSYKNLSTVNGNGTVVENPHVISWFTAHSLASGGDSGSSSDSQSSSGPSFWQRFIAFFSKLLSALFSA